MTIAIPTYKRLGFLQEAVRSAQQQDYPAVEILIGDDGPTEVIGAWSRSLQSKDSRVRYQKNKHNLGLAGNWNALTDAARGDYIVIIGDDDRLLPNFASRLVSLAEGGANVIFSNHYLIDEHGARLEAETLSHTRSYHRSDLSGGELKLPEIQVWQNAVPMSAALIRTSDVRRLRFKEDLNTPEIEFFLRLAHEGGRFVFTPEYLAEYRVHTFSATGAGLWSERLARHLLKIKAGPEAEPARRIFMESLLVDAVGRCLASGELQDAREFLGSEYYPKGERVSTTSRVQIVCAALPASLGPPLYVLVRKLAWRLKKSPRVSS